MAKTSSDTSTVELPPSLEKYSEDVLNRARAVGSIGYTPYTGPTVAGFTPLQTASMMNTNQAAQAFGTATPFAPMPSQFANDMMAAVTGQAQSPLGAAYGSAANNAGTVSPFTGMTAAPQAFTGGVVGYSPYNAFNAAAGAIPTGQLNALTSFFLNPQTGAAPMYGNWDGANDGGSSSGGPDSDNGHGGRGDGGGRSSRHTTHHNVGASRPVTSANKFGSTYTPSDPNLAGTPVSRFFNGLGWNWLADMTDLHAGGPVDYSKPTKAPATPPSVAPYAPTTAYHPVSRPTAAPAQITTTPLPPYDPYSSGWF